MYARSNEKVGFNIKLDKKLFGRKNIRLRPDDGDKSHLRSKLACDIANRMGVPSIQGTFARLYMNGEYWGLYVLLDSLKTSWVKNTFNPSGDEVTTFFQCKHTGMNFEIGTTEKCFNANDDYDNTLLERFVEDVNNCKTAAELEEIMDVEVFLKYMAFEWLIGSFDHFLVNGHNFYLYKRETDGKWLIIEHDYDNTFGAGVNVGTWLGKGKIITKPNKDIEEKETDIVDEETDLVDEETDIAEKETYIENKDTNEKETDEIDYWYDEEETEYMYNEHKNVVLVTDYEKETEYYETLGEDLINNNEEETEYKPKSFVVMVTDYERQTEYFETITIEKETDWEYEVEKETDWEYEIEKETELETDIEEETEGLDNKKSGSGRSGRYGGFGGFGGFGRNSTNGFGGLGGFGGFGGFGGYGAMNTEPVTYSFADWEMNIPLINVLVHQNQEQFRSIVREVLVSAFNPLLLNAHIDELRDFLVPYVKEDSTPGEDGILPGRINRKGSKHNVTLEVMDKHIETNLKKWISDKFQVACENYDFDEEEILNEAAVYVPHSFDYSKYSLRQDDDEKKKQEEEEKKKQEEEEKKKQEEEEKKKQEEEEKKKKEEEEKQKNKEEKQKKKEEERKKKEEEKQKKKEEKQKKKEEERKKKEEEKQKKKEEKQKMREEEKKRKEEEKKRKEEEKKRKEEEKKKKNEKGRGRNNRF